MTQEQIKLEDELISISVDIDRVLLRLKQLTPTRGRSIAITNVETAALWLKDDISKTKDSFKEQKDDASN